MLWRIFSTQGAASSGLAFASSSHSASMSRETKNLAPSQDFSGQGHNATHACGLLVPQGYVKAIKIP